MISTLVRVAALAAVFSLFANAGVQAAPARVAAPVSDAAKPAWNELTPAQQAALNPLMGEWDRMEAVRKQKWLEIASRFSSMQPTEQQRMHERMRDWVKLTPEQRKVARENYARVMKIDKDERSAKWEQYQQLPEEQKQKLAADAARKRKAGAAPSRPGTEPQKPSASTVPPVPVPPQGPAPGSVPPFTPPAQPAPPVPNAK